MKALNTATALSILAIFIMACRPAEKENPNETNEDNLEAVLNDASPEVLVNANTHIRFENQTRLPIAIKLGSTAQKIEPGSIVFIPEEYDDNKSVSVRIAQQKEGEWKAVYASRWHVSEKWIESYVANETTSGKVTIFGTRDRIEELETDDTIPRRRVIIENE